MEWAHMWTIVENKWADLFQLAEKDISANLEGAASYECQEPAPSGGSLVMHKFTKCLTQGYSGKEEKSQERGKETCSSLSLAEHPFPSLLSQYGPTHLGFSKGSGSFRALPTGFFSASSAVTKWNSASTLPCIREMKCKHPVLRYYS